METGVVDPSALKRLARIDGRHGIKDGAQYEV
jgi:hypothetical protein